MLSARHLICAGLVFFSAGAVSGPFVRPDRLGDQLMRDGLPAEAAAEYESAEHRAMALYASGDAAAAMALWAEIADAKSEYNLGTALTRAGDYQRAIEAFERARALPESPAKTAHNQQIAEQLLALQEQELEPPESSGEEGGGDQSESRQNDAEGQGQPSDGSGETTESEAEQNVKPEPGNDEGDSMPQSDEQNRESQQETEQLLRRVPDDPAGLLRARIVREHKRRHGNAGDTTEPW